MNPAKASMSTSAQGTGSVRALSQHSGFGITEFPELEETHQDRGAPSAFPGQGEAPDPPHPHSLHGIIPAVPVPS